MFLPVLLTYDNILTPIPTPCPTSPNTILHLQLTHLDGAPPTQPGYRSSVAPSQIHALICSHLQFSSAFCGFPLAWSLMSNCNSVFHVPAHWIAASSVSYSRHSLGTMHHALPLTPGASAAAPSASGFPTAPPHHHSIGKWGPKVLEGSFESSGHFGCLGRSDFGVEQKFFGGRRAGRGFQVGKQLMHCISPGMNFSLFRWQHGRAGPNWFQKSGVLTTQFSDLPHISYPVYYLNINVSAILAPTRQNFKNDVTWYCDLDSQKRSLETDILI